MTLTEFLLARIAEDEARGHGRWCSGRFVGPQYGVCDCKHRRRLAECEAKRRIVGLAIEQPATFAEAVAHLAEVYADHPDYREEWKP